MPIYLPGKNLPRNRDSIRGFDQIWNFRVSSELWRYDVITMMSMSCESELPFFPPENFYFFSSVVNSFSNQDSLYSIRETLEHSTVHQHSTMNSSGSWQIVKLLSTEDFFWGFLASVVVGPQVNICWLHGAATSACVVQMKLEVAGR